MARVSEEETARDPVTGPLQERGLATVAETVVNESELLLKAREGDLKAFTRLVETYQERIIRVAAALVGFDEARDAAQEAFLKVYENLGKFQMQSRFYTWLYRITVNTCRDFLRKRRFKEFFGGIAISRAADKETDPAERIPDPSKNAAENVLNDELCTQIHGAIGKLPFRQRTAFSLRYLEELSLDEIADMMDLTAGAVKAHLWQAGQKMRSFLADYRGDRHG